MNTKYAVYNAVTGENVFYDTQEDALLAFWQNVMSFAVSHFHNTAYTVVETNDDGSETWYNDKNEEIQKPKTAKQIQFMLENMKPLDNSKTSVEILP